MGEQDHIKQNVPGVQVIYIYIVTQNDTNITIYKHTRTVYNISKPPTKTDVMLPTTFYQNQHKRNGSSSQPQWGRYLHVPRTSPQFHENFASKASANLDGHGLKG